MPKYRRRRVAVLPRPGVGHGYSDTAFRVALRESVAVADPPEVAEQVTTVALAETTSRALVEATAPAAGHQLVQIISAGWGSSGHYSPQVLAEAAPKFRAGTPMYLDHPTVSEDQERPERSVRDLAAVLVEDATYNPDRQALVAQARVFAPYRELLSELAEHIGVSIRAAGIAALGEADGRQGLIVQEISQVHSVDYVTQAGRGGRVLALLESARDTSLREARSFGAWLESRLHLALTQYADEAYGDGRLTRDERITLSSAIGDALKVWTSRVEADAPQLFQRDIYEEPDDNEADLEEADTPTGPAAEPVDDTPPPPPASEEPPAPPETTPTEEHAGSAPDNEKEGVMPDDTTIDEIKAREAAAEQARVDAEAKLAEATRKAEEAEAKLAAVQAVEAARPIATAALAESDLPQAARTRVLAAVTSRVPLTEANALDEPALKALVEAEVKAEAAYLAELAEASGAGQVTGMGRSPLRESATPPVDATATTNDLIEAYKARGLSSEAAKLAASGRAF